MIRAILGLMIGVVIGSSIPIIAMNVKIISVLLIVSFDAIFGGLLAKLEFTFDDKILMSGFLLNLSMAVILVYLGDYLGINLHYMVVFALGLRIFKNLSAIRRNMIKKL